MTLSKTFGAIILSGAAAVTTAQDKPEWNVKGGTRILAETGDLATNLYYPEMFITGTKGRWSFQVNPDLVAEDASQIDGAINPRIHTMTAAYAWDNVNVKAGVLPPFGRRLTGADFDSGMMGAYLSDQLLPQGGVIGAQISAKNAIGGGYESHWHVMGGMKDPNLSEFGNPAGAGFNAPIWGVGGEIKDSGSFRAGYNYTSFGEGRSGVSQEVHYAYATKSYMFEGVKLGVFGEVQHTLNETPSGDTKNDKHYAAMVQAGGGLAGNFGWRAAAGLADDTPAVEGYLTYKRGKFAGQVGFAEVSTDATRETIGNMVLKREF